MKTEGVAPVHCLDLSNHHFVESLEASVDVRFLIGEQGPVDDSDADLTFVRDVEFVEALLDDVV